MSANAHISPSLKNIKSLPATFRYVGSPAENSDAVNTSNSNRISIAIPENGDLRRGEPVNGNLEPDNDDSPYGRFNVPIEESPLEDDDTDLAPSPSRSFVPLHTESKWSDTSTYAARKKIQSWFQLPDGTWELGTILSTAGSECILTLPEGKVLKVNPECLVQANPDILDGVDDLMQLSYLNEPSVLYNLQYRYDRDVIYTKAGPVLVAVNPFKKIPLYGDEFIEAYKHKSILNPHVYAITDTAIQEMIRDEVNQSIIIRPL